MVIPLRGDFDADRVRAAAKRSKDGLQARRLLALAAIYEGARRVEAAKIGDGRAMRLAQPRRLSRRFAVDQPLRSLHGRSWDRAVADCRSLPMDLGGTPRHRRQADAEPRLA